MMMPVRHPRVALVAILAALLTAAPASAHAVLERSEPPASAVLDAAPSRLTLWMSEPVDATFSTVAVFDVSGRRVSGETAVSHEGRSLGVEIREGGRGVYTVRWRVLSVSDGHTTAGLFLFSVGGEPAAAPTAGADSATFGTLDPRRVPVRWITYMAAFLLAGAAVFEAAVLHPGLRRLPASRAGLLAAGVGRSMRRVRLWAGAALLTALATDLALQITALAAGRPLSAAVIWTFVIGTRPGWSAALQSAAAALLLLRESPRGRIVRAGGVVWVAVTTGIVAVLGGPAVVAGSPHVMLLVLSASVYALLVVWAAVIIPQIPDVRVPDVPWIRAAAGAALLGGIASTSHAAGAGLLPLLADWVHLLAAASWIGGLAALLVALREAPEPLRWEMARALVPRMSALAAAALLAVLVTGVYAAALNVPAHRALFTTPYGRALLVKIALVLPIIGLGAFNRFVLRPGLLRAPTTEHPSATLRRLRPVAVEVALAAGVLVVVAALTITPPSRVTFSPGPRASTVLAALAGDVALRLTVARDRTGQYRLDVAVEPGVPPPEGLLKLRLTKLDEELTPTVRDLVFQSNGVYVAQAAELATRGLWDIEVLVRRRGRVDAVASWPYSTDRPPTPAADPEAFRLLLRARLAMGALRSWLEDEQLTDTRGHVVVTHTELLPPDRQRYTSSVGTEGIIIGSVHYVRTAGHRWRAEALPEPVPAEGVLAYVRGAASARLGRRDTCGDEPCRVVLWESRSHDAAYAGWVGESTGWIYRLMMLSGTSRATVSVGGYNEPLTIEPWR